MFPANIEYHKVLLRSEDNSLELKIDFIGYSVDSINEYLTKNFCENTKPFAAKWTQFNLIDN